MTGDGSPQPEALLIWYDRHRRAMPWRALPGEMPDPYRVWLSEIMLQQTTVQAVRGYFLRFLDRFPTLESLAAADVAEVMPVWAGLGYYSRARNLHACARHIMALHGGRFPEGEESLLTLPGIGPYTAAAIAAIAFGQRAAAVDGNVERVVSRLFRIEAPLPAAKPIIKEKTLALVPPDRPGDFAQALMDLGATICTPKRPACALCPWSLPCAAWQAGDAEGFPRKAAKKAPRARSGYAWLVFREDGAILLRTRPPRGLLGGLAEVPTSDWLEASCSHGLPESAMSLPADLATLPGWRQANRPVRHVFTHFALSLLVHAARAPSSVAAPEGMRFTPLARLDEEPLSTLMRKVIAAGLATLGVTSPV